MRLLLSVIAYNLVNIWRRLVLPNRIADWSLTGLRQLLVKHAGIGFDHGVGHPLLLLYDAKAHNCRKNNVFKGLGHYAWWPKVADAVIKAPVLLPAGGESPGAVAAWSDGTVDRGFAHTDGIGKRTMEAKRSIDEEVKHGEVFVE
jgi:hypothetical protein